MSWWRQHWRLGLALIATGLGLVLLLVLYALHKRKEAEELKTQLGLMNTTVKVAGLEADKKAREKELQANAEEAAKLDAAILQAKKDTVAVVQSVKEMSDEEVLEAFKKLGY
jgi:1,4-dihydroxy-2-naphthoyl-CoA synthase